MEPPTWPIKGDTYLKSDACLLSPLMARYCWEVDACNYRAGGSVDTKFACKGLPAKNNTVPCLANMASKNTNYNIATFSKMAPKSGFDSILLR